MAKKKAKKAAKKATRIQAEDGQKSLLTDEKIINDIWKLASQLQRRELEKLCPSYDMLEVTLRDAAAIARACGLELKLVEKGK